MYNPDLIEIIIEALMSHNTQREKECCEERAT